MQKWIDFYQPFFPSPKEVAEFVTRCEQLAPPNNVAKILMHQAQRLISLADDIQEIRQEKEPLQVLFLIMCAENIAKLHDAFAGEGQSHAYVRQFFNNFLSEEDKNSLGAGFIDGNDHLLRTLGIDRVIDILYDIRCDVVHEGNYWGFAFHDGNTVMVNTDPNVHAHLQFQQVRDIVVRGCINAVQDKLPAP